MGTTGGTVTSVELWVLATTLLLLAKFFVGSAVPRFFSTRKMIGPMVQVLHMLNYYSVTYTLGLMKPSNDEKHRVGAKVEDFFQVWAVLIVTMQASVSIGRPYRPVKMTLVDLLSSLWAANQLRMHTELRLKVPIWLIWSIHALRVIWLYVSTEQAVKGGVDNIKLVSDYMMTSQHTADKASPDTMLGYRYLVDGEEEQKPSVRQPGFTLEVNPSVEGAQLQVLTLEKVWQNAQKSDENRQSMASSGAGRPSNKRFKDVCLSFFKKKDSFLSTASDSDNRFKDVCLSFALYKLIRRRFYDFPIGEAANPALASKLVAGAILEEGNNGDYERALRITEVELSFLHDSLYSKHAVVFSGGFPWLRVALSLLMATSAMYLAYAVRDIPGTGIVVTGEKQRRVTIAHGVPITLLVIAIVVYRELAEVGIYVMSQWSKVRIICHYIRLKEGSWQRFLLEKVARFMFFFVKRGRWNQQIRQYNLLMSGGDDQFDRLFFRKVMKLRTDVKKAVFQSLRALIKDIPSAQVNQSSQGLSNQEMNKLLASYFTKAFSVVNEHSSSPSPPLIKEPTSGVNGESETYKILIWHMATSLCQIKVIQGLGQATMDLYTLKVPRGDLEAMRQHYTTAVSLSNYCAYLVTQGLVPDNGLVSEMVLGAMRRDVRHELGQDYTMKQIQAKCSGWARDEENKTILGIGARLSEDLMSKYLDKDDLWMRLAKFWTGYLLHLSASTRAAKHRMHLQGRGEFTTHLWVMLSHAGFLGKTNHGEQMLDPVDRNDDFQQ